MKIQAAIILATAILIHPVIEFHVRKIERERLLAECEYAYEYFRGYGISEMRHECYVLTIKGGK